MISFPTILQEIAAHKMLEVGARKSGVGLDEIRRDLECSSRDFKRALTKCGVSLIAEIKQASPSAGIIKSDGFDPVEIALSYERAGADAISVLTDRKYFGGDLKFLQKVTEVTKSVPILCKDFIVDEYQIYEARSFGADAVLLIAGILSIDQIESFLQIVRELRMDAICEVHNEAELENVLHTSADIIGINNRDLHTFEINMATTAALVLKIPKGNVIVAESGIESRVDIEGLQGRVDAVLVGTAIMKSEDIDWKIRELVGKKDDKPVLKICGVLDVETAEFCDEAGVDFIGLNFVPESKRRIEVEEAKRICEGCRKVKKVGIFQNQPLEYVNEIAEKIGLDLIQLSGDEDLEYVKGCVRPVIKGVSVKSLEDVVMARCFVGNVEYLLFDGPQPGSGEKFSWEVLKGFEGMFMLAGGIDEKNALEVLENTGAIGVDTASGVESDLEVDLEKVRRLVGLVKGSS